MAQRGKNPITINEDVGLTPGLTQWAKEKKKKGSSRRGAVVNESD